MLRKLSSKIVVYTTLLVLVTVMLFSMSFMFTIMGLKKYSLRKVETVFRKNADESLEKKVISYARILKGDMDAKESVSLMFGKVLQRALNNSTYMEFQTDVKNVFNEMKNVLDIRVISVFGDNGSVIYSYPEPQKISTLEKFVNKMELNKVKKKIVYYDFHVNSEGKVSFSFIFLGRDRENNPIYIAFDFYPYKFYSLVKTAQLRPFSQEYLWVVNKKGFLIYDPPTKDHPLITLLDKVNLANPKNGKLLSYVVKNDILKGKTGVARYVFRGVDKFVGYTYVSKYKWGLGLTMPVNEFYKPIKSLSKDITARTTYTLSLFGLFSSIVVLGSIFTTLVISKKVIVPINRTVEEIDLILNGDYSKRLPEVGIEELDKLAKAVNKLVEYFEKITKEDLGGDKDE